MVGRRLGKLGDKLSPRNYADCGRSRRRAGALSCEICQTLRPPIGATACMAATAGMHARTMAPPGPQPTTRALRAQRHTSLTVEGRCVSLAVDLFAHTGVPDLA